MGEAWRRLRGRWGERDSLSRKACDALEPQFQKPKHRAVRTAGLFHPCPPWGDVKASVRKCPHQAVAAEARDGRESGEGRGTGGKSAAALGPQAFP